MSAAVKIRHVLARVSAPRGTRRLPNTALTLIRRLGYKVIEGFEHFAEHRLAAVEAVRGRRTE